MTFIEIEDEIMFSRNKLYPTLWILCLLLFISCTKTAFYSSDAYRRAVELKVESLYLMNKATESFNQHEKEVEELKLELNKAYEFARSRPHNQETIQQWRLMTNPSENLMGGVLKLWEKSGKLSPAFIKSSRKQIKSAFNAIIELEGGKIRKD